MEKPDPKRRGWFRIPGVQESGDRSIEEQMTGLESALEQCKGKSVLDVGCAEGPISLAFAKAGAARVFGLEYVESHLTVARYLCQDFPNVTFQQCNLKHWANQHRYPEQFDIVLALGVIHKLHDPAIGARFAAQSAKDLLLFRGPGRSFDTTWDGAVKSKHTDTVCNWYSIMRENGFTEEQTIRGGNDEAISYWRRTC